MAREFPNWQTLYAEQGVETMPWYNPILDRDLENAIRERRIFSGHFLDLGTGPGTQALELALKGFQVTGADISTAAILKVKEKAKKKALKVKFVQDDILASKLKGPFDYIFDRGCFHIFEESHRATYVATIHKILSPQGLLFLKCFSASEPGEIGPFRFSEENIKNIFGTSFTVESIQETLYQGTLSPVPKALFCILKKK